MKKFNYKSRKGFTLIELLVVIGILAVLAAIAIPSVAGLIDRANVSADDTNANEMTNALERFTSEYELFCQDIASGKLNTNDLDAAQSRVYNVTGADSREDITLLEGSGLAGKKINRDTKYPENVDTARAIIENYTKTSSVTFEPKQSDMHFYYSADCGVVVFSEATDTPDVPTLNKLVVSGKDAKGRELSNTTAWVDLTTGIGSNYIVHNGIIPEGGEYTREDGTTYEAGDEFPEIKSGDSYIYGLYKYNYNGVLWRASALNKAADLVYPSPIASINNQPLKLMTGTFGAYKNSFKLADDFQIPNTVTNCNAMFQSATGLTELPANFYIPDSVNTAQNMFNACKNLKRLPDNFALPRGCQFMQYMFNNCSSLENAPAYFNTIRTDEIYAPLLFAGCTNLKEVPDTFKIPEGPSKLTMGQMFANCTSLEKLPNNFVLPKNLNNTVNMFLNCQNLTGTIIINCDIPAYEFNGSLNYPYDDCFTGTTKPITIKGSSPQLVEIAATATNNNVTIG